MNIFSLTLRVFFLVLFRRGFLRSNALSLLSLLIWLQRVVILTPLAIKPVKGGYSAIRTSNLAVTKEAPNLTQSHRETFLALCCLNLTSIELVPVFQVTVIPQHDVLNLLFDFLRPTNRRWPLKFYQIVDVEQVFEWILFNLSLSWI